MGWHRGRWGPLKRNSGPRERTARRPVHRKLTRGRGGRTIVLRAASDLFEGSAYGPKRTRRGSGEHRVLQRRRLRPATGASGGRLLGGGAVHAATPRGGGCASRGSAWMEGGVPGWARHGRRRVRGRRHGHARAHLGGDAERPDRTPDGQELPRPIGAQPSERAGHGDGGRQDQGDPPLLRPHDDSPDIGAMEGPGRPHSQRS